MPILSSFAANSLQSWCVLFLSWAVESQFLEKWRILFFESYFVKLLASALNTLYGNKPCQLEKIKQTWCQAHIGSIGITECLYTQLKLQKSRTICNDEVVFWIHCCGRTLLWKTMCGKHNWWYLFNVSSKHVNWSTGTIVKCLFEWY